jgi:hypothetical protein
MKRKYNVMGIIFRLAMLVIIILAIYFYNQTRILNKDPKTIAAKEVTSLVDEVSKIVILPEGETPTVATVSDAAALKSQAFFAQALKGDKVLIYTKAGKAVLYRPSVGKIVEVSSVKFDTSASAPKSSTPDNGKSSF